MSERQANTAAKTRRPGLISRGLFTLVNLVLLSLLAWLLLLGWFLGEAYVKKPVIALQHAQTLVLLQVQVIANSTAALIKPLALWLCTTHQQLWQLLTRVPVLHYPLLQTGGQLLMAVTEIELTRLIIVVMTLPLLLLLGCVFLTDGLVQRDIRKFQGARETTFIFHRLKHGLKGLWFGFFFIYLSLPVAMNLLLLLWLQTLLLGLGVKLTATFFKKYV